jgi:hypothetical protein
VKYPWRTTPLNQTFFVKRGEIEVVKVAASVFSKRNPGFKFEAKKVEGGVEVRRVL